VTELQLSTGVVATLGCPAPGDRSVGAANPEPDPEKLAVCVIGPFIVTDDDEFVPE
jgi:hypothetical protein